MIITSHAAQRLASRGILLDDVERIVRTSQPADAGDMGNLVFFGYGNGGVRLKIITTSDRTVLVSAMKTGRAS